MFVAPDTRKRGAASALCSAVIRRARAQGYRVVRLTTGMRQPEARALSGQLGFRMVAPWDSDPPEGYDYFERAVA